MAIAGVGASGGLSSLTVFLSTQRAPEALSRRVEQDPIAKQRIDDFRERAGSITSVEDLVSDRRVLSFVLDAFDLGSEVDKSAFVRLAIEGGPGGFANFLRDVRYRELASFLDVPVRGLTRLTTTEGQNELVEKFTTIAGERSVGFQSERARQALFFKRVAPTISDPLELLGNNLTRDIVLTTLNLPPQIALQSIDKQRELVEARIDVDKLDEEDYVDEFLTRFLVQADLKDSGQTASAGAGVYANQQLASQLAQLNPGGGLFSFVA